VQGAVQAFGVQTMLKLTLSPSGSEKVMVNTTVPLVVLCITLRVVAAGNVVVYEWTDSKIDEFNFTRI